MAVVLPVLAMCAACAPVEEAAPPPTALPEQTAPTTSPALPEQPEPEPERPPTTWHCGEVKAQVYAIVNDLAVARNAANDPSHLDGLTDEEIADIAAAAEEAQEEAQEPFGVADQVAMTAACRLYGQHEAALELWDSDQRGDACDVWIPAGVEADDLMLRIDLGALHPLPARFLVGATGDVAEGVGRCIAERAN